MTPRKALDSKYVETERFSVPSGQVEESLNTPGRKGCYAEVQRDLFTDRCDVRVWQIKQKWKE